MSEFALAPVTLTGEHVRLEPLGMDHVPGLLAAARDGEIWSFLPIEQPATLAERLLSRLATLATWACATLRPSVVRRSKGLPNC